MATKASKLIKTMPSCIPVMPVYFESFTARNFNTSPLTIDGLLGDTYDYTVLCYFHSVSGDSILDITCNTDTAGNYRNYEMKGLSSTASAAVGDADTAIELQNFIGTANPNLLVMKITGDSTNSDERYFDIFYSADGAILKQSSYWKDTSNELTQIVLTAASSVTCDAEIYLFAKPKDLSENWTLIEELSWSAETTEKTFSGLDGDIDKQYLIDWRGDQSLNVEPNNDGGTNYTRQYIANSSGTISAANTTSFTAYRVTDNSSLLINAESGDDRLAIAEGSREGAAIHQFNPDFWWLNTGDNITSLACSPFASGSGTAKLYKKKNPDTVADRFNLPFKILKETAVSGDFSSGDTLTFDCDKALMIKIEGIFSTVGNDLRLQLDGDTGSNYTEQYVKGVSSTASAASTTTTFELLCDASASKVAYFEYYLYPKSGENRPSLLVVGHGEDSLEYKAHWWLNSADEINTIKVFASSTTTCTGTLKYSYIPIPNEVSSVSLTDFDGTDDYINISNDVINTNTDDYTLSGWFYLDSLAQSILWSAQDSTPDAEFSLQVTGTGTLKYTVFDASDSVLDTVETGAIISGTTLYHIALTKSGSTIKIYLDGSLDTTDTITGTVQNVTSLQIGADTYGGSPSATTALDGSAGIFQVFDRALTDSEISYLYNSGTAVNYTALTSGLKGDCLMSLEATSRDSGLTDQSGNSNNGTANGGLTIGASAQTINLKVS